MAFRSAKRQSLGAIRATFIGGNSGGMMGRIRVIAWRHPVIVQPTKTPARHRLLSSMHVLGPRRSVRPNGYSNDESRQRFGSALKLRIQQDRRARHVRAPISTV